MVVMHRRGVGIFVDRSCPERWIVRDADGNFWSLPPSDSPWDNREPYYPTEPAALEPVPGHYQYVLDIPG